jgi:hypothetical protein
MLWINELEKECLKLCKVNGTLPIPSLAFLLSPFLSSIRGNNSDLTYEDKDKVV